MKSIYYFLSFLLFCNRLFAMVPDIVVDASGNGDFRTIQSALDSHAMFPYQRTVIYIRNGLYHEKIRIEKNYVTLAGESRDSTIIEFSQKRADWEKDKDFLGPAVVNIHADDVVLENLTIRNSQQDTKVHAFTVYGTGTRTILNHCNIVSRGGDTVSLWNYKTGMYYHSDCRFEGAVDFVCPRGWCFIRDSQFYEVRETAALWHAGHFDQEQKLVIVNSYFDGVSGFHLGRHHYDAQFYFIRCQFSDNLANKPIDWYLYEDSKRNNPNQWGNRVYFYRCEKEGSKFDWMNDNLPSNETLNEINANWTFQNKWAPEKEHQLEVCYYQINSSRLFLYFNEPVTVKGQPILVDEVGNKLPIAAQRYLDIDCLEFIFSNLKKVDINGNFAVNNGFLFPTKAYLHPCPLEEISIVKKK